MGRLKAALQARYKDRDEDVKIHTPRNLETLQLNFRGERVAKVRKDNAFYRLVFESGLGHRKISSKPTTTRFHSVRFVSVKRLFLYIT